MCSWSEPHKKMFKTRISCSLEILTNMSKFSIYKPVILQRKSLSVVCGEEKYSLDLCCSCHTLNLISNDKRSASLLSNPLWLCPCRAVIPDWLEPFFWLPKEFAITLSQNWSTASCGAIEKCTIVKTLKSTCLSMRNVPSLAYNINSYTFLKM